MGSIQVRRMLASGYKVYTCIYIYTHKYANADHAYIYIYIPREVFIIQRVSGLGMSGDTRMVCY